MTPAEAGRKGLLKRERKVFDYERAKVTVVEAERGKGVLKVEYGAPGANAWVFRQTAPDYGDVMTSCLRELYSGIDCR